MHFIKLSQLKSGVNQKKMALVTDGASVSQNTQARKFRRHPSVFCSTAHQ